MRKVRKSLIRRRNSSAEDYEDYRRKSKGDEEEEEGVSQCRPRANSKHSYLSRMRSKSDEEVFESSLDRRFVVLKPLLFCVSLVVCPFVQSFTSFYFSKFACAS